MATKYSWTGDVLGAKREKQLISPMAFPSSLVEPVNILKQKNKMVMIWQSFRCSI